MARDLHTLRTLAGYAGWTDEALLEMPYARFRQAVRVAEQEAAAALLLQGAYMWGGDATKTREALLRARGLERDRDAELARARRARAMLSNMSPTTWERRPVL